MNDQIDYNAESAFQTLGINLVMINDNPGWTCIGKLEIGYQHRQGELVVTEQEVKITGDSPNELIPQVYMHFAGFTSNKEVMEQLYEESLKITNTPVEGN